MSAERINEFDPASNRVATLLTVVGGEMFELTGD